MKIWVRFHHSQVGMTAEASLDNVNWHMIDLYSYGSTMDTDKLERLWIEGVKAIRGFDVICVRG